MMFAFSFANLQVPAAALRRDDRLARRKTVCLRHQATQRLRSRTASRADDNAHRGSEQSLGVDGFRAKPSPGILRNKLAVDMEFSQIASHANRFWERAEKQIRARMFACCEASAAEVQPARRSSRSDDCARPKTWPAPGYRAFQERGRHGLGDDRMEQVIDRAIT